VSSQTSVYFAVNPSLAMFAGFASGCITGGQVWKTQLVALSSYAPIRIWKIDPYARCPVGDDGTPNCAPGHVAFIDIPNAFTQRGKEDVMNFDRCNESFAVEVSSLEYLNQENIAVTILEAPFTEYNQETGALLPNTTQARYRIMYVSTVSMAISDSPHTRDYSNEAVQGQLCANMRRFPNVGSIVTESTIVFINIFHPIVSLIVTFPALLEMWRDGRACALNTHGHSILRKCGSELLSLDDMFDSIIRANGHFWAGFALVSQALRGTEQPMLANVVDGVAYYGDAISSPVGVVSNVIQTVRIPVTEIVGSITHRVFPYTPPGIIVASNPVKMAQFSYQLVTGCVSDLVPLFLRIDRNHDDVDAARSLVTLFVNRLFQARDAYYQSITQGVMQGCSGLALMIGYDNPWGTLVSPELSHFQPRFSCNILSEKFRSRN
jgi:hypothetical protein